MIRSIISFKGEWCVIIDIKYVYLSNLMLEYEYTWIPISRIHQEIIDQYNLLPIINNEYVMIEIWKGIYGTPQAIILANTQLCQHLTKYGYKQTYSPDLLDTTHKRQYLHLLSITLVFTTTPIDLTWIIKRRVKTFPINHRRDKTNTF